MDKTNAVAIIIAIISALTALASQRAAAKASTVSARSAAEEEAYIRARKLDVETIQRLEEDNAELRAREKENLEQIEILKWRVSRLERGLPPKPYPDEEN